MKSMIKKSKSGSKDDPSFDEDFLILGLNIMRKLRLNYIKPKRISEIRLSDMLRDINPETEVIETIVNKEISKVKRFLRKGKFTMDDQGKIFEDGFYFKYVTINVEIDRKYFTVLRDDRGCFSVLLTISNRGLFNDSRDFKKMRIKTRSLLVDEFKISRDPNNAILVSFIVLSTKYKLKRKIMHWFKRK